VSRKLIGLSLVPQGKLPSACTGCRFWEHETPLPRRCGAACDPEAAARSVHDIVAEWGECGRAAVDEGEALGFIKYGPPRYFPQARFMPSGPPDPDVALITCMHIDPDARGKGLGGVLMRAALKDLAQRGERTVQMYADATEGAADDRPIVGVAFAVRHGFVVARPHPEVPLMRLDLKSLVSWTENLESVLESLRLPLRVPDRAPVTLSAPREDV